MTHKGYSEKVLVMRIFLAALVLIFSLQSLTKADDISDFEIEGMSVGDSLLDYMNINQIESALPNSSNVGSGNDRFIVIWGPKRMKNIYDQFQVTYRFNDKKYIIHAIDGQLDFDKNFSGCKIKMNEIKDDIKSLLNNVMPERWESNHIADKTNKSKVAAIDFDLKSGGRIQIWCTDWGAKISKEKGWINELSVSVRSNIYQNYIDSPKYN